MKKYISCLLLLLALALPMLGMEAQAATTGTCGENVTWTLDDAGILTISGTGAMADYASASDVPWYASRASVKSVVIKDGVTTIGDRAFYNCAVLTDVTVGSGVKTVGTFAFQGCSALGEIVLPAAVTALEDSAFRGCAALETMTFGGNAPTVGSNVFTDGASDMTVRYYEGNTGFDATPWTDYYHETMHVGQWVVDTEPGCTTDGSKHIDCTYCETIITETIPSRHDYVDGVCSVCQGIQLLGSGSCGDDLTWELDIRGVLTISGTGSMRNYYYSNVPWRTHREQITSVILEEGVTSIGNYAFYECRSLESVTILDSVNTIGSCAFAYCSSLTDVYITDIAAWLNISFGDSYANPLEVNDLSKKLYLNGNLVTNLVIPEGITTIGNYAFLSCSSLESITIPDSVTEIGYAAFSGCSSLESVTIPDSVTEIGSCAFENCSSLASVTIGDSVTTIDSSAFSGCSSLESVTIPDSVTEIGYEAFYNCSSLTDVYITDIAAWLNISFGDRYANPLEVNDLSKKLYLNGNLVTNLVIPEGVTTIGDSAFSGCSSLESVTIPDSVTEIYGAFYNCSSLESVTIPDSVTTIDSSTFAGCSSLESVTIPDSVTEIGSWVFYNCSSLKSVTIPDSVTEIGYAAFSGCSSLESVTIGDSVTEIGSAAFYNCSSLKSVTIPDSVTEIGLEAFSVCRNLQDVYYEGTSVQWESINYTPVYWRLHYECATADNHWTAITKPATCAAEGYTAESCTCNYIRNKTAIPVEKHNYASVITPPTCTEAGYTTYTCTECGDAYTDDIQEKLGHDLKAWVMEKEATFQESGLECRYCRNCDYFESRDIPPKESKPNNPFVDVFKIDYYYAPVLWAVENGITNGLSEITFGPDATCTRGQIVTFLWRANGSPEPKNSTNPFWDVTEGDYFYKAVLWAVENGITSGMGDGSFAPNAPCTRGQVATFLWRTYGEPTSDAANDFYDVELGAYYYDAVLWAVENGITNGMGDGTFAPDAPCTRGQIVTFLYRAMA